MLGPPPLLVVLDLWASSCSPSPAAWSAVRKELDIFGVLVLAGYDGARRRVPARRAHRRHAAGGAGGLALPDGAGRCRAGDLLLPPGARRRRAERVVTFFDAAGLGLFCVTGALAALDHGLGPLPAALMGMVTGIGGGIARDLLSGRVPAGVLQRALRDPGAGRRDLGGAGRAGVTGDWLVALPGVAICFGWRLLALRRNWHAPLPRDRPASSTGRPSPPGPHAFRSPKRPERMRSQLTVRSSRTPPAHCCR